MSNLLFACVLFGLMVQSFALPTGFTIRAVIGDKDELSATVIEGIIIGIVVVLAIPVLWYCYKICHRDRPTPRPLFALPPPTYPTNASSNHTDNARMSSFAGRISRPHKAHTKVNAPTSRA